MMDISKELEVATTTTQGFFHLSLLINLSRFIFFFCFFSKIFFLFISSLNKSVKISTFLKNNLYERGLFPHKKT